MKVTESVCVCVWTLPRGPKQRCRGGDGVLLSGHVCRRSALGQLVQGSQRCQDATFVGLHDLPVLDHLIQDDVDSIQVEHDLMVPSQRCKRTQDVQQTAHGSRKDTSNSLCGQKKPSQTGSPSGSCDRWEVVNAPRS